jgi:hypothetical protein
VDFTSGSLMPRNRQGHWATGGTGTLWVRWDRDHCGTGTTGLLGPLGYCGYRGTGPLYPWDHWTTVGRGPLGARGDWSTVPTGITGVLYPPEQQRADGTGGLGYCSIVQPTLSHCHDLRLTEFVCNQPVRIRAGAGYNWDSGSVG